MICFHLNQDIGENKALQYILVGVQQCNVFWFTCILLLWTVFFIFKKKSENKISKPIVLPLSTWFAFSDAGYRSEDTSMSIVCCVWNEYEESEIRNGIYWCSVLMQIIPHHYYPWNTHQNKFTWFDCIAGRFLFDVFSVFSSKLKTFESSSLDTLSFSIFAVWFKFFIPCWANEDEWRSQWLERRYFNRTDYNATIGRWNIPWSSKQPALQGKTKNSWVIWHWHR